MKHITVTLVTDKGVGWNVFDENGQRMESVMKVEIIQEARGPTTARVTFIFPRVLQQLKAPPA